MLVKMETGASGRLDMSPLLNKVILSALPVTTTTRITANVIGISEVSFVFNAGQATSVTLYGYVGDIETVIDTYSKSASAQTANVENYERFGIKANNSGTVRDVTVTKII